MLTASTSYPRLFRAIVAISIAFVILSPLLDIIHAQQSQAPSDPRLLPPGERLASLEQRVGSLEDFKREILAARLRERLAIQEDEMKFFIWAFATLVPLGIATFFKARSIHRDVTRFRCPYDPPQKGEQE